MHFCFMDTSQNKCNSNTSTSTTAKQPSEAPTRNFAKPISSKEVDEAIQRAFQKRYRRIAYIVPICGKNG